MQLNLSDNIIYKVEGLGNLPNLDTIQLKRNKLGKSGDKSTLEDLKGLLECPTLTCLDLSENYLDDPEILPEIFEKMPKLAVLYL